MPLEERFEVALAIKLPRWVGRGNLDKALFIGLVVVIVAALGCLGYVITNSRPGEKFTEFYILGPEGKAENYPQKVMLGEEARVVLGIVNHEYEPTDYRVVIEISGIENKELHTGTLTQEERWEKEVGFTLTKAGLDQKVQFWLYKDDDLQPCLKDPLHLYIDVKA